jgi:hypothetical protein
MFQCSSLRVRHKVHFLPSPRRYSSGSALASWTISLHSSLFFIFPPHPFTFLSFADVDFRSIHASEADCLVSEQFSFYGVRSLVSTWGTRVSLFVWLLPLAVSGMCDPTSSYATAGIALRVSGALKPHHLNKVETPSVGDKVLYPHKTAGT